MKLFWEIVRLLAAVAIGYSLSKWWGVSGWVIVSGYLLGAGQMHIAHLAAKSENGINETL